MLRKLAMFLRKNKYEFGFLRVALVVIFFLFGYAKFFSYEAKGLEPLISNSGILSWLYSVTNPQGAAYLLGVAELSFCALLAAGAFVPYLGVLGGVGACITFLTTLTLVISTPGAWEASAGGFPAMGGQTGFLIKDLVLLAASLAVATHDSRRATKPHQPL